MARPDDHVMADVQSSPMKGVQFLFDEHGERKAVLIDLRKNKALWEDFYDIALARERESEPRESLAAVTKKLLDE
jgi:hypothetical protein